ncbi:hypothetical protein GP486_008829, partial [Trichoglossum hirsutum]
LHSFRGGETSAALQTTLTGLLGQLSGLVATTPSLAVSVPREIIAYVEDGRNPDIYTREFVELVQRQNLFVRGKADAFAAFRDVLAEEIASALPALKHDVDRVLRETRPRDEPPPPPPSSSSSSSQQDASTTAAAAAAAATAAAAAAAATTTAATAGETTTTTTTTTTTLPRMNDLR